MVCLSRQVVMGIVLVNGLLLTWPKLEVTLYSLDSLELSTDMTWVNRKGSKE